VRPVNVSLNLSDDLLDVPALVPRGTICSCWCSKAADFLQSPAASLNPTEHDSPASRTKIHCETSGFIGFDQTRGSHSFRHLPHLSAAIIADRNIKKQIDALLK
jgi:hypothetical protein